MGAAENVDAIDVSAILFFRALWTGLGIPCGRPVDNRRQVDHRFPQPAQRDEGGDRPGGSGLTGVGSRGKQPRRAGTLRRKTLLSWPFPRAAGCGKAAVPGCPWTGALTHLAQVRACGKRVDCVNTPPFRGEGEETRTWNQDTVLARDKVRQRGGAFPAGAAGGRMVDHATATARPVEARRRTGAA